MPIEIVAAQSEQERQAALAEKQTEFAERRVRWALRELTANLIRIARGAGKPHVVEGSAARFLEACHEYRAAAGHRLPTPLSRSKVMMNHLTNHVRSARSRLVFGHPSDFRTMLSTGPYRSDRRLAVL